MLYISLCISAVFLVVVNLLARRNKGAGMASALTFSGIVTICSVAAMMVVSSLALIIANFAVSGVALLCIWTSARPRYFAVGSVVATLAAYVYVGWSVSLPDIRRWEEMQSKYPVESLEDRLAYESRPHSISRVERTSFDKDWLASLEEDSQKRRRDFFTNRYLGALELLHAGTVKQFVASPGFGAGRLPIFPTQSVLIEPRNPLTKEEWSPDFRASQSASLPWNFDEFPDPPRTGETHERAAHRGNILAFLEPWYLGYARDRQHVAGFRPHAFHKEPTEPLGWLLRRLDLVGILKLDEPVVYQTQGFPSMEEAKDAPTRPLDPFESEALTALLRGEDLVARESPKQLRLFGSLRATKHCLSCHHGERGDLLGAFSYQLYR